MFLKTVQSGGGESELLVPVYKDGNWNASFSVQKYHITESNNTLNIPAEQGAGIVIHLPLNSYSRYVFIFSSECNSQHGTCESTASLPTITTVGTGRHTLRYGVDAPATSTKQLIGEIETGYDIFIGAASSAYPPVYSITQINIKAIYLIKK